MLKSLVVDKGSDISQKVFDNQSAFVASEGIPPFGVAPKTSTYREFLKDINGSSDMSVATPTVANPEDFFVTANPAGDVDRWIKLVAFQIAAAGASPDDWGTGPALTDPIIIFYEQADGVKIIADDLISNYDFIRLAAGEPGFGTAANAFLLQNSVDPGNLESYIPTMDMQKVFGMPYGIRLAAGTEERLVIRLQDDTTGAERFNAVAYGMDRRADS